jgi:MFS family permease
MKNYINKTGIVLVVSNALSGIIWGANSVILSIYLINIGVSPFLIGITYGGFSLLNALGSILVGYFTDAIERTKLYILLSLLNGTLLLLFITNNPYIVLFAYLLTALFNRNVISTTLLGEYSREYNTSENIFSLSSSLNIGFSVLGSLLSSLPSYIGILGYYLIFIIESASIYLSGLLIFTIKNSLPPSPKKININLSDLIHLKSNWLLKRLLPEALIGLGAGVIIPLFSLWFYLKFNVDPFHLSIVYAISNITLALGTLSAPLASKIFKSRVKTIITLQGLATILLIIIAITTNLTTALTLFILRNTLMNMSNPLLTSLINDLAPSEEKGRIFGIWNTASSIPRALGPGIGGYLINNGYLDTPIYITAILYTSAITLFYILFKNIEPKELSQQNPKNIEL